MRTYRLEHLSYFYVSTFVSITNFFMIKTAGLKKLAKRFSPPFIQKNETTSPYVSHTLVEAILADAVLVVFTFVSLLHAYGRALVTAIIVGLFRAKKLFDLEYPLHEQSYHTAFYAKGISGVLSKKSLL